MGPLRVAVREIPFASVRQRLEGGDQLSAVGGEGVRDLDRGAGNDGARDEPALLKLFEPQSQLWIGDARDVMAVLAGCGAIAAG
ncbi:hypothetical protein GCM10011608_61440 [Micromonospora sonchi]|uniref:Uncharacterized protein n=1 Tax=Micromonospora sonchi TaxID=1763543 RepID=A0A917X5A4_9ACTN|nr:hypothetical protein GCM10011608_61440 [Micromonospora sonchi]